MTEDSDKPMKIVVIDLETSGFSPEHNIILEIGAVLLDLSNGAIKPLFNELIKEEGFNKSVKHCWALENSDLSFDEILEKGKSLDEIRNRLQSSLDQYPVTAFNSAFDIGFLSRRGFNIPKTTPCIMKTCTPIVGIKDRRGRNKWPNVDEAWAFFFPDISYTEKHRGFDDAAHEARILYKLYQNDQYPINK